MLRLQHALGLPLIVGFTACTAFRAVGSHPTGPTPDEVVWAAILGAVAERAPARVLVDPQPIAIRTDGTFPQPADYRSQPTEATARLVAQFSGQGIDTVTIVPPTPCQPITLSRSGKASGCPAEPYVVLAFDAPRRAAANEWTVLMVAVGYNPQGRVGGIYEIAVGVHERGPVFLRQRLRVSFD